uniref:NADH dehydrogenase subunit 6 n=1 Tax=Anacestra spiniger TaxID=2813426 RepID=A0A8T9ZXW9_9HEMI|nr:NADH dehydrogenase subunit 6 [Anacestra spiniger]
MMIMQSLLLASTLNFMWMKTPLSMGFNIIIQTLIISMMCGLHLGSFWFSYIILIVMLSGMLVLFIYMASIASNQKFKLSLWLILLLMNIMMMSMMMMKSNKFYNNEMFMNTSKLYLSLNYLFNMKFSIITIMMMIMLLMMMISVSMIVNISEGPLRINKK